MHLDLTLQPLSCKLAHYSQQYLQFDEVPIIPPSFTSLHLPLGLRMFLGQFQVCSHQLRIEMNHHLDHFIFQCSVYYEIRCKYHYLLTLFQDSHGSLSTFLQYHDQHCLALYLHETFLLRKCLLASTQHSTSNRRITSFFWASPVEGERRRCHDDSLLPMRCTRRCLQDSHAPLRTRQSTSFFPTSSSTVSMTLKDQ